ncbi:precorrin-2/cobalt-factor-2 C20-methyltransferase [Sporobacter termitidis DSM 10068]|uniref:Precorrin-2/cobalt-factor-2 C20-methyltransferase n=1 Tax=Sporobacter termitidis DSM 10068 TaxID=1123282 RepID=A0A1M5XJF2_9FIRM|nr:precorrin-2 C(20)-methyltransferase [Sporobacter termitidis]SHH99940.1 precorrin-2/cobalt-factor-2 C20-methyltransferase [Sporobacter termitidis DSM 10068]
MAGTLYGVGVGPGDPELLTLKAARIITESGLIAVPKSGDGERVALGIARQAVAAIEAKPLLELDMPMTKDAAVLRSSHKNAAESIIGHLRQGTDVAFLTLGDPSVYSTYIYVHRLVRAAGFEAEIIPGVPSFCAVAAKLSDALVETSEPLHVIPGSYGNLRDSLRLNGTKVFMKSGKAFGEVRSALQSEGLLEKARMVANCGMKDERVYDSLADVDASACYFSVIVVKDARNGTGGSI